MNNTSKLKKSFLQSNRNMALFGYLGVGIGIKITLLSWKLDEQIHNRAGRSEPHEQVSKIERKGLMKWEREI